MKRHDNGEQNFNYSSMKQELDNEKNRHLRTLADFDNYRKRVDRDNEYSSARGKKELI
jgi:molecular chaperone GrpE